jgi:ADP-ribosylglycohydrolase
MTGAQLMRTSLEGLSVGDAFGERFFQPPDVLERALHERRVPGEPPWAWTDDTAMALSLVETLAAHGTVEQDDYARRLARRYTDEPSRGYGRGAHDVLTQVAQGTPWPAAAKALFHGQGSMGNGAAMRVAPLGAFFASASLSTVVEQAHRSAAITHAHPEGQAGAVAVAVAAACLSRGDSLAVAWTQILARTPHGLTRDGLERASRLGFDVPATHAAEQLGSGQKVLSHDTVPFSIWCALKHRANFSEALWNTVLGLGDRDTTCAIVGGLVGLCSPPPENWVEAREKLPL